MTKQATSKSVLAVDYGASGGRCVLCRYDGALLHTEEIHRFSNDPVRLGSHWYWDFPRLFDSMLQGLYRSKSIAGAGPDAVAVDTWGVDYGIVDGAGRMLENPYHYRDPRTEPVLREVFARMNEQELYRETGVLPQQINTLFQICAWLQSRSYSTGPGTNVLFMPDLFTHYLSGERVTEYSIASTGGLTDPLRRGWNRTVLDALSIPESLFTALVEPGRIVGTIRSTVRTDWGLGPTAVIATASHDTASAVVSIPAADRDWAFISCGTWSLMGIETEAPVIDEEARKQGFTNEGGFEGTNRLLKNIPGLWLVQQCRKEWELDGEPHSYEELQRMANEAGAGKSHILPQSAVFQLPGPMASRIQAFCRATGQEVPVTKGAVVRCALESLALEYRRTLEQLDRMSGRPIQVIHMVGGGIRNRLLCQLTASATGRTVIAGPVEATAVGNALVQLHALNEAGSLAEMREIATRSFPGATYFPKNTEAWEQAYAAYLLLEPADSL